MKTLITYLIGICLSAAVFASDNLTIIIPNSPGGPSDLMGRALVQTLSQKRSVIVTNKAGANGIIGSNYMSALPPDGNNIYVSGYGILLMPVLSNADGVQYTLDSLVPVASLASMPMVLVVSENFPANNFDEFVQEIKKNPNKHSVGIPNIRSGMQAADVFKPTGAEPNIINYKGESQQLTDLMSKDLSIAVITAAGAKKYVDSKHIKAIAILDTRKWPYMPGVSPVTDSYPAANKNLMSSAWWGVFVPAGTSSTVIQSLNTQINQALADPTVLEIFKTLSCQAEPMSVAQVTEFHKKQISIYKKAVSQ
jgi:tripartite-type tricarboxylate transporter receptor subunit TctC